MTKAAGLDRRRWLELGGWSILAIVFIFKGLLGVLIVVGAPVALVDHFLQRANANWTLRGIMAVFIFVAAFAVLNQLRFAWPALDSILLIK